MNYQNVATPRFYIDHANFLKASNKLDAQGIMADAVGLRSPTNMVTYTRGDGGISSVSTLLTDKVNWCAILGHNFHEQGVRWYPEGDDGAWITITNKTSVVNSSWASSDYSGFGIARASGEYTDYFDFTRTPTNFKFYINTDENDNNFETIKVGSVCYGTYYDMPHSPDLELTLSYKYDGSKTFQTQDGGTLSNSMYVRPASWGSPAWTLGAERNYFNNDRTGRRTWDLSFSYLSDEDVMPTFGGQDYDGTYVDKDILSSTDFFSQVWNKTLGGQLPFIFQPNKTNNEPDQFAICKFISKSLNYKQVAVNIYNINLKIEEVW